MERNILYSRKIATFVLLVSLAILLLAACGDDPVPTPTVIPQSVPLLPTVRATATPIPVPTSTVMPTASAAVASPLTGMLTATLPVIAENPLTVTTVGLVTQTSAALVDNSTVVSGATGGIVIDHGAAVEPCTIEVDIALAAYPDLQQYLGCALAMASFEPVAFNEFGPGPDYDRFMLWFSSENQIYVLLPNHEWQRYADSWTEDQATFLCNPLDGEPTSPPLPRRGFGKVWCTVTGLQSTMGMVEREERLCQHTVTQHFTNGRLIACYEDATIRFFRVMEDGTWAQLLTG